MSAEVQSQKTLLRVLKLLAIVCLAALVALAAWHLEFQQPFIGYGLGGAFLLFLAARPGEGLTITVCGLGVLIAGTILKAHYAGIPGLLV